MRIYWECLALWTAGSLLGVDSGPLFFREELFLQVGHRIGDQDLCVYNSVLIGVVDMRVR